jgi:hypothetical protein
LTVFKNTLAYYSRARNTKKVCGYASLARQFSKTLQLITQEQEIQKRLVATLVLLDSLKKHSSLLFKSKKYKKGLWLR